MRAAAPDSVCRLFDRAPDSLIEEPEVCELCANWRDGFCVLEEQELVLKEK